MLVTKDSRKVYYYTRIKYYESDAFFKEKLNFVMEISYKSNSASIFICYKIHISIFCNPNFQFIFCKACVVDFIFYGYMNKGSYEGKTAVILYRFYKEQERVEERVYI